MTLDLQRMSMKKVLAPEGLWNNVVDNRQEEEQFTADFKAEYAHALTSLKSQLEALGKLD